MRDTKTSLKLTLASFVASVLTTALLYCVLDTDEWFVRSVGAIALVAGIGALCRLGRFPALLIPLLQVAGVLVYLTSTYASADAQSGWLPGQASLRTLSDLADAGFTEIDTVTPPLIPSQPVALVVVGGVALMAILVDFFAAGLRQTALAGVPLLVLYVVPAAVLPDGVDGALFLLPAVGYLLLLITDSRERLLRWGVAVSGRAGAGHQGQGRTRSAGELGQMTRRVGVTVLSMSIAIPALAPRLSDGAFGSGGLGNNPDGGGTISTLNPLVSMRRDLVRPQDVDLLKIATNSVNPDELYLRAVTLDTFDGEEWKAGRREVSRFDGGLPDPIGMPNDLARTAVETSVQVLDQLESDYVPMPYPATQLKINGSWRVDPLTSNVVSHEGPKQITGQTYTVESLDLNPQAVDVTPALSIQPYLAAYLDLPEDLPARVKELATKVTKGQTTVLGRAIALQQWFRDPDQFAYDLRQRPGTGKDAILAFLADRRGYCEQFASTMAVMARFLGIPARVNVGFTPGSPASDGTRTVSAHDAHAWPELFMPGVGWTRFEPTPGSAASNPDVPNWLSPKPQNEPAGSDGATQDSTPSPNPSDGTSGASSPPDLIPNPSSTACPDPTEPCTELPPITDNTNSGSGGGSWLKLLAGLATLVALLSIPALTRIGMRRRRWYLAGAAREAGGAAEWAWIELRDSALDLGYTWPEARTPRQTSVALSTEGKLDTAGADALAMITQFVERIRYAPHGAAAPGREHLRDAVDEVRRALATTAGRQRRLQALLIPRSVGSMIGRVVLRTRVRAVAARQSVLRTLRLRRA